MKESSRAPEAGPQPPVSDRHLKHWLTTEARALVFADCRVAPAGIAFHERLQSWLAAGHHAGMGWMEERSAQRGSPAALWPQARSVVMLSMNYGPEGDPLRRWPGPRSAPSRSMRAIAIITTSSRQAERAGAEAGGADGRGCEGVRRHGPTHGEAAGAGGRTRLAGQAHGAALARARQLAVPPARS